MIERGRRLTEADAGTNATTRRALAVAGLEQEVANLGAWGKDELHRLVAAFLEVRFPTVVVLNKCDRPSARAHVDRLKAARPGLDLVPPRPGNRDTRGPATKPHSAQASEVHTAREPHTHAEMRNLNAAALVFGQ